jgi:hypothetical protein
MLAAISVLTTVRNIERTALSAALGCRYALSEKFNP